MNEKKTVFLDANILYSWNLNHLIMFFCDTGVGLLEPYWSVVAVDEAIKNIKENTGDDTSSRFLQMNKAYPYANVTGYQGLLDIPGVDHKDQPIAKAAIFNECDFLITDNYKHFKKAAELQTKPKVITPDTILTALVTKYPQESLLATVLAWWHKDMDDGRNFNEYLTYLGLKTRGQKLVNFEKKIRVHISTTGKTENEIAADLLKSQRRRY